MSWIYSFCFLFYWEEKQHTVSETLCSSAKIFIEREKKLVGRKVNQMAFIVPRLYTY